MTAKEKWRRFLVRTFIISVIFTVGYTYYYLKDILPDKITVVVDEQGNVNLRVPFSGTLNSDSDEVLFMDDSNLAMDSVLVNWDDGVTMQVNEVGSYELVYRLFGLFDFQKIQVDAVEEQKLIPCGMPVGIYLETDGVMVIGLAEITDENGSVCVPADGKIRSGDYIREVNGVTINSKEDLLEAVADSDGEAMELAVWRDDAVFLTDVTPVCAEDGSYKLGIWVRNDCQGIGTLTYVDEDGDFGALGHAISDTDIGMIVHASDGTLREAEIHSIIKGSAGTPGSLAGSIRYQPESILGDIYANSSEGIFGKVNENGERMLQDSYGKAELELEPLPIGYQQEVTTGTAYIRSFVSGKLEDYEVKITGINTSKTNHNKGIVLEVTDQRLIEQTGGIVQGMSGSPIIQNGKIIGAVTHVFVQDSTKGYGIFIEKMLESQTELEP